ncbi:unnamed protein product [Prunus armeniaca]
MRVASMQCTPNFLKAIMCFENLGLFVELDCGLQEFLHFFKMRDMLVVNGDWESDEDLKILIALCPGKSSCFDWWLLSPLRLEEGGLPSVDNIMWWKRNAHALQDDDVVIEVSSIEDYGKRNETKVSLHPD